MYVNGCLQVPEGTAYYADEKCLTVPMLLSHTHLIFLVSWIIYSLKKDAFSLKVGPNTAEQLRSHQG